MVLETERLLLRYWEESDAEDLYEYAKDPRVGPSAAWPVHTSVRDSLEVIRNVLTPPENFAVVLKETGKPAGSIGYLKNGNSNIEIGGNEAEIGYWIGTPFWGKGLIPEAAKELIRYLFEDLEHKRLWCCSDAENKKSRRVWEKCGFLYHHTEDKYCELIDETRATDIAYLTKEAWDKSGG